MKRNVVGTDDARQIWSICINGGPMRFVCIYDELHKMVLHNNPYQRNSSWWTGPVRNNEFALTRANTEASMNIVLIAIEDSGEWNVIVYSIQRQMKRNISRTRIPISFTRIGSLMYY